MKTLYLKGVVGIDIKPEHIESQITKGSKEKLRVFVNSVGGLVSPAYEIYNIFDNYQGEVEFVIQKAFSAMSYIVMSGDTISAFKNSMFMGHRAQGLAVGDADVMLTQYEITSMMDNVIAEAYTRRIKKPKEEILKNMRDEIWLIGWEKLTEAGIIDNVIDSPEELLETDEELKKEIMFSDSELAKYNETDIRHIAKIEIDSCFKKIKLESENILDDGLKLVAMVKEKQNQTPIEKPVEDNIITEEKMNLQEFLSSNPEAKAEYEADLLTAEEKGKEFVKAENSNDRLRIANILKAGGISVTDSIVEAIDKGIDAGEFALAEIERQKNLRPSKSKSPFASIVAKQTPAEHSPEEAKDQFDIEKVKSNIKAVMSNIGGI